MILVSFSSAEDALSNDANKYDMFCSQGAENLPFRFFGTRCIFLFHWQWFDVGITGILHRTQPKICLAHQQVKNEWVLKTSNNGLSISQKKL